MLREEHTLMVVQNGELGRIFRFKRVGLTRDCKKLHNGGRRNVCVAPNCVGTIKWKDAVWAGHVACWGGCVLVGKCDGKELTGRTGVDWSRVVRDRSVPVCCKCGMDWSCVVRDRCVEVCCKCGVDWSCVARDRCVAVCCKCSN